MYKRNGLPALLLLFAILLMSANACKKKDAIPDLQVHQAVSARPAGQAVADTWFETIGPDGGLVTSEDGRIEIDIPAGAVSEYTEIGIQPLHNTAVSGIGYSYRLTPHGTSFQKKVTIRFHYNREIHRLSSNLALEVAFQDAKGVWNCIGNAINDTTEKTIAVETDHFSDWALIASMELSPPVKTLGLSESITLKAVRYVHPVSDDDFLVPLTIPNAGSGEPMNLEQSYIVKWTLNGPGKLEPRGSGAVYTAPSATPADNMVTVTVELNVKGKQVLLISTIYIITEGINISINGGPWSTYPAWAIKMPGLNKYNVSTLNSSIDLPQIILMWPAISGQSSTGIYSWSMLGGDAGSVVFQYTEADQHHMYVTVYDDGVESHDSGGFMAVEEKDEGGKKYLTGLFAVDQAGYIENASGTQLHTGALMGTFKVQRNW